MTDETTDGTTPAPPDTVRTFVAIELPPSVKALVSEIEAETRAYIGSPSGAVKWVKPEGIHLTLQFLGNVAAERIPEIEAAIRDACVAVRPFALQIGGLGAFPHTRQPRVLWLGLTGEPDSRQELSKLQSAVTNRLQKMGFRPDKSFKPHLTLGRIRGNASQDDFDAIAGSLTDLAERSVYEAHFRVTSISLMRSDLQQEGAVYSRLADIRFGKNS